MRRRGELDEAQLRLEAVERFAPDEPAVLFNLAGLWLQRGDLERAADYLSRIPRTGLRPDLAAKVAELEAYLSAELAADRLGEIWREEEDEKPIRPNITLLTALSRVPVQWLNAAAAAFGLPPVRLRKERARRLAEAMRDPERLREVLAQVSPEARDALRYVLDQGGWCKLSALTRRFGNQEGDGFWWDEQPPTSPIGQLRARCLLMVGRAALNGRRHRIAVVPAELRPLLATVLATGGDHIE
ncbi:MAG: tetratricopeptide repeat protein [Firmicutes bacterium]|nr:tetratricopeptide repeat protein [Bacillota bacterium]